MHKIGRKRGRERRRERQIDSESAKFNYRAEEVSEYVSKQAARTIENVKGGKTKASEEKRREGKAIHETLNQERLKAAFSCVLFLLCLMWK